MTACGWTLDPEDGGPVLVCDLRAGHDGPHRCGEVPK